MKEKLYFKIERKTGYSLQLVIDLQNKTYKRGYCLVAWRDLITLKNRKEMDLLCNTLNYLGFVKVDA